MGGVTGVKVFESSVAHEVRVHVGGVGAQVPNDEGP
jgi:hypothetical protein